MAPMILSAAAHGAFMRAFLTMALGDSPLWKSVGRGTAFWWKEFQKWRRKEWTGTRLQVRAFSPPPKMVHQKVFSYLSPVSCRVTCFFCFLLSHVMVLRFSLSYVMVLCFSLSYVMTMCCTFGPTLRCCALQTLVKISFFRVFWQVFARV